MTQRRIVHPAKSDTKISTPSKPGLPRKEDHRNEVISQHEFDQTPATVTVGIGVTKSMGEGTFEFLRVDVSVSMPCLPNDVEETQTQVSDMVWGMLDNELDKAFGQ